MRTHSSGNTTSQSKTIHIQVRYINLLSNIDRDDGAIITGVLYFVKDTFAAKLHHGIEVERE